MKSETVEFIPVLSGKLDETYALSSSLAQFTALFEKYIKPEVHNVLHCLSEDRATATGSMYRKFGEIRTCGF